MHISLGLNSRRRRTTTEESTNTSQQSDDNTSDEANTTNHSYWRVRLPDDELDNLMWGERGVPSPPSSPPPSRFRQQWARDPKEEHEKDVPADNVSDASSSSESPPANDNILTALDGNGTVVHSLDGAADNGPAGSLPPPPPDAPPPPPPDHPPAIPPPDDPILLEDILWKQRSGLGKYSLGILQHEWEQRRVVLFRSGMLRYYALPSCVEGVIYDPDGEHGDENGGNGSPWVYKKVEPRGEMYLGRRKKKKGRGEDVRVGDDDGGENHSTPHRRERGAKIRVRTKRKRSSGPTPFEIKVTKRNNNRESWRLCFLSEWERNHWLEAMSQFTKPKGWEPMEGRDDVTDGEREQAADTDDRSHFSDDSSTFSDDSSSSSSASSDDDDHPSNGLGDHGFQPGDHILRWEMLPIIYPIQIHGIVLEAGKNCVIIADFGLASYDPSSEKAMRGRDGLTTWEDERKDDDSSHDVILAAWEKIKPREKKRLNVVVVTDPKEIRKWSKISYGDRVEDSSDDANNKKKKKKKKKGFFDKLTFGGKSPRHSKAKQRRKKGSHDDTFRSDEEGETATVVTANGDNNNRAKAFSHDGSDHFTLEDGNSTFDADEDEAEAEEGEELIEGEPEWFRSGYKPRRRTNSTSSAKSGSWDGGGQSVFSIDHHDRPPTKTELPKSDSAKLVLARTHFILENEDLLPPYHVFYSNSECIAVWCKTGRWSTLQAAVYLVSSSVGFGKSATMLTISVAAAHAILLPAVAVGGLAVVGAPLLFLKKSQEKWEKTTMKLTGEFWARAPPEVFVEAIEYWGGLRVG